MWTASVSFSYYDDDGEKTEAVHIIKPKTKKAEADS